MKIHGKTFFIILKFIFLIQHLNSLNIHTLDSIFMVSSIDKNYSIRNATENVPNDTISEANFELNQLEKEEKILNKKLNEIRAILNINVSNIDLDSLGDKFDLSYKRFINANDKLRDLKNITNNLLKLKKRKIDLNINNNKKNVSFKKNKTNNKNKTSNVSNKESNLFSNNFTFYSNSTTTVNPIKSNLSDVYEKEKNVSSNLHEISNDFKESKYLSQILKSKTLINITNFRKDEEDNENFFKSITDSNSYGLNETEEYLPIVKEKSLNLLKINNKKKSIIEITEKLSKESLYTRLINISLSLVMIGVMMGLLIGLILVMYINTKNEKS